MTVPSLFDALFIFSSGWLSCTIFTYALLGSGNRRIEVFKKSFAIFGIFFVASILVLTWTS